jgi:hypothetical protein
MIVIFHLYLQVQQLEILRKRNHKSFSLQTKISKKKVTEKEENFEVRDSVNFVRSRKKL